MSQGYFLHIVYEWAVSLSTSKLSISLSLFPVSFQLFCWNLERMLPNNQKKIKKTCKEIFTFFLLSKLIHDHFSKENTCIACFIKSQSLPVCKTRKNQKSIVIIVIKIYQTKRCQEDITMSIASSLSVGFENVMFLRNVSLFL